MLRGQREKEEKGAFHKVFKTQEVGVLITKHHHSHIINMPTQLLSQFSILFVTINSPVSEISYGPSLFTWSG